MSLPDPSLTATRESYVARPHAMDEQLHELLAMHMISKRWGQRQVLDEAELVVDAGTAVHLAGRNGVGKTTLLRIASGLIGPDAGVVELDGLKPVRDRRRYAAAVGFLTAGDRGLIARLTVRQTLRLWARLAMIPGREIPAAIDWAVEHFGLQELVDHRLDRSSLGQRQRVRLAQTFMHRPRLVLLDEPTNSLDEEGVATINAAVDQLLARNGAVVWCSPGQDGSVRRFDATYHLADGKVVEQ
jgi:ABC-type multidrug transport system ATPase subunit